MFCTHCNNPPTTQDDFGNWVCYPHYLERLRERIADGEFPPHDPENCAIAEAEGHCEECLEHARELAADDAERRLDLARGK